MLGFKALTFPLKEGKKYWH